MDSGLIFRNILRKLRDKDLFHKSLERWLSGHFRASENVLEP